MKVGRGAWWVLLAALPACAVAATVRVGALDLETGDLAVEGSFTNGAVTMERTSALGEDWEPVRNAFTTNASTAVAVAPDPAPAAFYRTTAWDFSGGAAGFTNVTQAYGLLTPVAGAGSAGNDSNEWQPAFENGPATNARLSTPHIAIGNRAGEVFIADKDAHAVRKVTTNGLLLTVAGINAAGNGADAESTATNTALSSPNGLWVAESGTVFILDMDNGKVRRLATNGTMRTLFAVPGGISSGRGLWVSEDESLAYVACGTVVKQWSALTSQIVDYATGFQQLGNIAMDPRGRLVVTDRNGNSVWRLESNGTTRVRIAGNGNPSGGGEGQLATATGLAGVRGVWFLPTGAFFVCTHAGGQVWYVDADGIIHLFLNGSGSNTHMGDGTWFYAPSQLRVSEVRAVTVNPAGDVLITENDRGYVRRVRFLPCAH